MVDVRSAKQREWSQDHTASAQCAKCICAVTNAKTVLPNFMAVLPLKSIHYYSCFTQNVRFTILHYAIITLYYVLLTAVLSDITWRDFKVP